MEVPRPLIERSNLTAVQVESLQEYLRVKSHETTLKEAASSRSVRIGSYYRTVKQGKDNVKSSVYTVIIALWLGFVKGEDLRRLLDQAGAGLPELQEGERERLGALIEMLVERIVA